ncbi:MAG: PilZ domain-containing protein [Planctomycetota bacterium]|nr:MAG: PilZ domain-containing protein [Planctomycetota bacterium]
MSTQVIHKLTRQTIAELLKKCESSPQDRNSDAQHRRSAPWLHDCSVEIWPAHENWHEPWLGKCRNISAGGLGMCSNHYLEPGIQVTINLHLVDSTIQGKATVRYCQKIRDEFMAGIEFDFDY